MSTASDARANTDVDADAARALRIIEGMPCFAWEADASGRFTYVSPNTLAYLGSGREDLNESGIEDAFGWRGVVHPDDYDRTAARWRHCLRTGDPYETEHRLRRADGDFRWFRNSGRPARDGSGRITAWYGTTTDIDEQKRAEAALRESENELAQLVDMVPSHLWRLTPEGEPTFFNRQMVDFLGLGLADLDRAGMTRLEALAATVIHPDDASRFHETLTRCLATAETFALRYRLRRSDGIYRWMSSRAVPMRDPAGRIVQWYGLCHDIEDQTRLYGDLAEREARIRRLVDSDIIGIVIWDLDGTVVEANDAFLRMVQYERQDVQAGLRWLDMTPPEWQEVHAREEAEELAATGKMQPREKEYFRKDGSRVPVLIGAACFEGQSRQGVAYILDLTESKRAEAALRDRERELSHLVDMVPSYLWRITPEGVPVFFNKRLADFLGFDVAAIAERGKGRLEAFIATALHPDDAADVSAAFARALAGGERLSMRWRMRRADGAYRWMAASAEAMRDHEGRIVQWYGLCQDIDDQLQAEEALRSSKRQLEQMIDALPFSILSFSPTGKLTYVSRRYLDQAGMPPADIQEFNALARDVAHPEDFPEMHRKARDGFATGQPFVNRFRRRLKDGGYRWIEARAQPLRDADGAVVQWYFASIDIEDEMRAHETLRERERFLSQLVETLPAMIDCATPNGEPIYRSRQLREFLGYDLEALDGAGKSRLAGTLEAGVHPDDLAAVKEHYAQCLASGEPYARRHRLRRSDGDYRWVETRASPMRDADGDVVQWNVICLDVDGEVRMQEELRLARDNMARQSQAASLAELSASIAHEVNQPLAAIVANSHACHRWLSADPPNLDRAKITVERIVRDANSAADVVSRIRALFRQSTEGRTLTMLGTVIADVRSLMEEEAARRRVNVEIELEDDLPAVMLDRTQIQQVLFNLVRNGMEAMEGVPDDKRLRVIARPSADGIRTEVVDHGRGIANPDRIFEPFFTTKGQGLGMGLAICRSIVESHGGRLWAANNRSGGARFVFTLPVEPTVVP